MATDMILAIFENFNEPWEDTSPPPVEDVALLSDGLGEIREEAWTDGYMTGRQERDARGDDQTPAAKLLTSVHELEISANEAADAAALAVADLLVNTVIAATSDNWSVRLLDRVRTVAERIKPALSIAPEFLLRDSNGVEHQFADISQLSQALGDGCAGEDVTIRWHRGEATISRMALLEDLRDAIIPLSSGLAIEQNARHQT